MTQTQKSRLDEHFFHIARFVLEADSAFSIGSGLSDIAFDTLVVRDANGLPAVPGTTIAGVIRHLYREKVVDGEKTVNWLFGNATKEGSTMSKVTFSWGVIHDEKDQPVEKLEENISGLFLDTLVQDHPLYRDRVRITKRGVASDQGKFDITVIPKGCRFSFEMTFWAGEKSPPEWNTLLKLLYSPMLRFGGSVRSGLGRFRCIRLYNGVFNMEDSTDYAKYCEIEIGLNRYTHLKKEDKTTLNNKESCTINNKEPCLTLHLQPDDFWRFGQGGSPLIEGQHPPDDLPLVEPFIEWKDEKASIGVRHLVIPGSSVKGAIRHRFIFHYGRLLIKLPPEERKQRIEEAGTTLFGEEHKTDQKGSSGCAGKIWFDDWYINIDEEKELNKFVAHINHSSIDRFTGGVRGGALFSEELIWKREDKPLKITVHLNNVDDLPVEIRQALQWTLADLTEGRLALGAGSARGHGFFSGTAEWSDRGVWLSTTEKEAE